MTDDYPDPRLYYDDHVADRLRDWTEGNARIEAALELVYSSTDQPPGSVLEVGCGVGHVSHELSRRWPEATVLGVDTSERSVELAQRLFADSRTTFVCGRVEQLELAGPFELVLLMDTLEHVPAVDRPAVMAGLRALVTSRTTVVITVPTPGFNAWLRQHHPERIQPVDEDITPAVVLDVASQIGLDLLLYRTVSVWRDNDYAHVVLGDGSLRVRDSPVPGRPPLRAQVLRTARRRLGRDARLRRQQDRRRHVLEVLGPDFVSAPPQG